MADKSRSQRIRNRVNRIEAIWAQNGQTGINSELVFSFLRKASVCTFRQDCDCQMRLPGLGTAFGVSQLALHNHAICA